jgi:hypothetical protein
VEKLKLNVPSDRILVEARKMESSKIERINLLNRNDVNYLFHKHNIDKKRHVDELIATALKVQEWNANGKNYAFCLSNQEKFVFLQTSVNYPAALIMLKCHFIVMASNELTSGR